MHAAEKVRDGGFRKWDVFTPFPVHGMDKAMGMRNSKVGWFSFIGGVTGYTMWHADDLVDECGGLSHCHRRQANVQPFQRLSALIRIDDFVRLIWGVARNAVSEPAAEAASSPAENRRFALASHDRFFLVIETCDPKYSETETRQLLESVGSTQIEMVEE